MTSHRCGRPSSASYRLGTLLATEKSESAWRQASAGSLRACRRAAWLLGVSGLALAWTGPGRAAEPDVVSAEASQTREEETPREVVGSPRVEAAGGRGPFRGSYDGREVRFWTVEDSSGASSSPGDGGEPSGSSGVTLAIPPEARTLPFSWRIQPLRGGTNALWARWGSEPDVSEGSEHYSVLVLGAASKGRSAGARSAARAGDEDPTVDQGGDGDPLAPKVVFRGWSRPDGPQLSWVDRGGTLELYVTGAETTDLCGRRVPTRLRRLKPSSAAFTRVRVPPLGATERRAAVDVELPAAASAGVRLHLPSVSGSAATDGDPSRHFSRPYDFFVVRPVPGPRTWVIELAEVPRAQAELYVATEDSTQRLIFSPDGDTQRFAFEVPHGATCVAFVQGSRPLAIAEVVAQLPTEERPSVQRLIAALDQPEPGWAPRALAVSDSATMEALGEAFPHLSPLGRRRALEVARDARRSGPVLLAALATDERTVALEVLAERRGAAEPTLLQALHQAPADALAEVVELLVRIHPHRAVDEILLALHRVDEDRGRELARVLAGIDQESSAAHLVRVVETSPARWEKIAPVVAVTLLRELGSRVAESKIRDFVLETARAADFETAYLLVPLLSSSAKSSHAAREQMVRWLRGDRRWRSIERSAVAVALLERLATEERELLDLDETGLSEHLMRSENVRVRAATLQFLSHFPAVSALSGLKELAQDDPWPRVRRGATTALGALMGLSPSPEAQQAVERGLVQRARRDREPSVRRAAVDALGSAGSQRSLRELRKRLRKDQDGRVRAEAALALGRRCDAFSIPALDGALAAMVREGATRDDVLVGFAALSALLRLSPPGLDQRIEKLLDSRSLGPLRSRVEAVLLGERGQCALSASD